MDQINPSPDPITRLTSDWSPPLEDLADTVDRVCAEQLVRWLEGDPVPSEVYLDRYPELLGDLEAQFELVYNEFLVRESLGSPPTVEELIGRFPQFADRLDRQLGVHLALRETGESTLDAPTDADARVEPAAGMPAIPGYEVIDELGRGGMGVVYKAHQEDLGRLVALKVIRSWLYADPAIAARFRSEAELAARFEHPNIVRVYQVGEHDGQGFLALEYASGGSLQRRVAEGPMDPREAAGLVEQLAGAVAYAHLRGVIHRDLKPGNVVLSADGVPKLTDFGLAKLLENDSGITRTGDLVGTPSYMAPEQASASPSARVGPWTDIYALGAILYAALTGRPPFEGRTPLSTLEQVTRLEPLPPGRLCRNTPSDLETICLKCLDKDPAARYPTAEALADDLRRFLDGRAIRARRVSWVVQVRKWCAREPVKASLIGALAAAIVAGLFATTVLWRRAEDRAAQALAGRQLAAEAGDRSRQSLSISQIARALLEWRGGAVDRVDDLLEKVETDHRGWEWSYLHNLNHAPILSESDREFPESMAVAFSPDGSKLATLKINPFNNPIGDPSLASSRVDVHDLATGRRLSRFDGPVTGCRISIGAGGRLAVGGANGEALLAEAETGRVVRKWQAGGTIGFTPDGRSLVVGRHDSAAILDAADGSERLRFPSSGGRAIVSPSGRLLAITGPEAVTIRVLPEGSVVKSLPLGPGSHGADYFKHEEGPDLAFSPDETLVAIATDPPRVWNLAVEGLPRDLIGHDGPVYGVAFAPDGRNIATAGLDSTIRLWDARAGVPRGILRGHAERAAAVAFHPDGHLLASAGRRDGDLKVWDLTHDPEYRSLPTSRAESMPTARAEAISFAKDGRLLVAKRNGLVERWDPVDNRVETSSIVNLTQAFLSPGVPARFNPAARRLATVGIDSKTVFVLDLASGVERRLIGLERMALAVSPSPDGKFVAASAARKPSEEPTRREIRVWEVESGATVASWLVGRSADPRIQAALDFSPARQELAFDDYEPEGPGGRSRALIAIRSLAGGLDRLRLPLAEARVHALAYSPDGSRLAATDLDGVLVEWSTASGAEVFRSRPKESFPIYTLAFSPDGRRLAGVDREKLIVWDAATGDELIVLRIHGRRPSDGGYNPRVAWSPDGRRLASSNWDMSVTVWDGAQPPSDPADRLRVASMRAIPWHLAEAESAAESGSAAFALRFHLGLARVAELSDAASYARRAALLARLDDWPAAVDDWRRWADSGEPDDGTATLGLTRGLLRTGDRAGYRDLCARLFADRGAANRPVITWQVARALALSADSGIVPAQSLGLARAIPPSRKQAGRIGMTVALATLRAGQPDEALDLAIKAALADPSRAFACWPVASLALRDLGRFHESRDYLRKAEAHAAQGKTDGTPFPEDWPEFLLLLDEARNSSSATGR